MILQNAKDLNLNEQATREIIQAIIKAHFLKPKAEKEAQDENDEATQQENAQIRQFNEQLSKLHGKVSLQTVDHEELHPSQEKCYIRIHNIAEPEASPMLSRGGLR